MKKNIFFILFLASVFTCQAQMELKINPLGLLFSNANLSLEFRASEYIGIEPSAGISYNNIFIADDFNSIGRRYGVNTKYYFKPQKGFDNFYSGIYLRGEQTNFKGKGLNSGFSYSRNFFAIGYSAGYKWVSKRHIVFDVGLGIGRKLVYKQTEPTSNTTGPAIIEIQSIESPYLDGFFRFGVGYRFGGSSK
jgi:Protein of unknown function (DUF3575)